MADGAFPVARRDSPERPAKMSADQFVAAAPQLLADIQQALFDRARSARDAASVRIDSLAEFVEFFAESSPAGLAYAHFTDGPEMEARCKELRISPRCIPLDGDDEPGVCLFTGQPSRRRAIFARSY